MSIEFDEAWGLLRELKWYYDLHSVQSQKGNDERALVDKVERFILEHMSGVFCRRTEAQVEREMGFHKGPLPGGANDERNS
jgi:hypothetical protein